MDRQTIKKQALTNFKANYGLTLGITLVYSIILGAASATTIGTLVLIGPMSVGLIAVTVMIYNGSTPQFSELFSGFNSFSNTFIAGLLKTIFLCLWTLLFIVPGIVKSYSYALTEYILKENPDIDGYQAIQQSKKMMKGHKGELFMLDLSFIGWHILGFITLGLLEIFFTVPYHTTEKAGFLQAIYEKECSIG